jgi:hypothetical protein
MVIRFTLRPRRSRAENGAAALEGMRLETHPSGLNRTDARRLSRREIEHRERMLQHLHRLARSS